MITDLLSKMFYRRVPRIYLSAVEPKKMRVDDMWIPVSPPVIAICVSTKPRKYGTYELTK